MDYEESNAQGDFCNFLKLCHCLCHYVILTHTNMDVDGTSPQFQEDFVVLLGAMQGHAICLKWVSLACIVLVLRHSPRDRLVIHTLYFRDFRRSG